MTIAARPDASLWLTVAFGPRSLNSSPARPAAAFATVLLNSSAGAPAGPPWKNARRDTRWSPGRRRCRCRARRRRDRRRPGAALAARRPSPAGWRRARTRRSRSMPPQLHRRDPRGGLEAGARGPRGSSGSCRPSKPAIGRDAGPPSSSASRKRLVRVAERRDDADARDVDDPRTAARCVRYHSRHGPYVTIAIASVRRRERARHAAICALPLLDRDGPGWRARQRSHRRSLRRALPRAARSRTAR